MMLYTYIHTMLYTYKNDAIYIYIYIYIYTVLDRYNDATQQLKGMNTEGIPWWSNG